MVILVVHGLRVFSREPKRDPPVSAHLHSPSPALLPFQGMETQAGQLHIAGLHGDIQATQDQAQPIRMLRLNSGPRPHPKEALQPPVPEAIDGHWRKCNLSSYGLQPLQWTPFHCVSEQSFDRRLTDGGLNGHVVPNGILGIETIARPAATSSKRKPNRVASGGLPS